MALNHVALTVADRERSAAFYAEHFGLTRRLHDDAHLLIVGDGEGSLLALSEGHPPTAELPRTNHFGFQLGSTGEVRVAGAAGIASVRAAWRTRHIEGLWRSGSPPARRTAAGYGRIRTISRISS